MAKDKLTNRLRSLIHPTRKADCCPSCAVTAARVEALEWLVRAILGILVADLLAVLLKLREVISPC